MVASRIYGSNISWKSAGLGENNIMFPKDEVVRTAMIVWRKRKLSSVFNSYLIYETKALLQCGEHGELRRQTDVWPWDDILQPSE